MTPADLFALCDAPGWSTGRVARVLGLDPATVRAWRRSEPMPRARADWLARVTITDAPTRARPDRVVVTVDAPRAAERAA